jgi:hypothetical protein
MRELIDHLAASKTARVMQETWGHLAPVPRLAYQGTILFAHGAYGDLVIIRADFPDLPDSPWFFDDLNQFVDSWLTEAGKLYEFSGTYTKFKNGGFRFSGKPRERSIGD